MTESFAQLFEQSLANQRIRPGMILTGLIVDVTSDVVIVNVGLKSEAVIPLDQFKNERGEVEVKPGDSVEVALDSVEDGTGETRLSREKASSILYGVEGDFHGIAGLDLELPPLVLELLQGDDGFGLQADVDDDDVAGDVHHEPGQDHPGSNALIGETLLEELGETFCHTFTRTAACS